MLEFDTRKMMNAAAATATAAARSAPPQERKPLSPAALLAASQPIPNAYSPIVLAGTVRLVEFALIVLVGLAVYFAYVVPIERLRVALRRRDLRHRRVVAMLAFQAADIYQVQAFRGYEKQYFRLASAWSVVFLLVIGATFFAKVGDEFSRVWLGSFYVIGLITLLGLPPRAVPAGAHLDPRGPARPPHRDRRRRRERRAR